MKLSFRRLPHSKTFLILLVCAGVTAWLVQCFGSTSASAPLSGADRAAVFEEVWRTVSQKYYDPSFNGVDWNAVGDRYRSQLRNVGSEKEFYALLNRMTGELHDAHTRVRTPQQSALGAKRQRSEVGILIYEVEETPVIFDVTANSAAAQAGVKPGMLVRTVNGRPVQDALRELREEVGPSSSARAAKILCYQRLIEGDVGETLNLGLTTAEGTPLQVALPRTTVTSAPQIVSRTLSSGVTFLRVSRFRSPASKIVRQALEKSRDARGVILDLRANTGGDGKEGLRIAGYFLNQKTEIARLITRTGKPPSAFFGLFSLPAVLEAGEAGQQLFGGPLVLLINEGTGSTSELIAATLQEMKRARIIGTPSAGSVLGVLKHRKLRGGATFAVSEVGLITPHGRRIEGTGVIPDEVVPVTLRDLQHGHDAALEAAERYLARR